MAPAILRGPGRLGGGARSCRGGPARRAHRRR
jgi:hypothetical protein